MEPIPSIIITLAGVYALLTVYAAVPAALGTLLGVRLEKFVLGLPPSIHRKTVAGIEWVLGSLPIAAHAKFYGEEGLFGVRQADWSGNEPVEESGAAFRPVHDDAEEPDEPDPEEADDDEDDAGEPAAPADSYMAAHPLARALIALSGPVVLILIGSALLVGSEFLPGPALRLAPRAELSQASLRSAEPWSHWPTAADWTAIPQGAVATGDQDRLLPPVSVLGHLAAGIARFAVFVEPGNSCSGHLTWPVMLVRGFEVSPAFATAMFGLLAFVLGAANLLPIPIFNGGVVLLNVLEWLRGRRPTRRTIGWAVMGSFVWLLLIVMQLIAADLERFD